MIYRCDHCLCEVTLFDDDVALIKKDPAMYVACSDGCANALVKLAGDTLLIDTPPIGKEADHGGPDSDSEQR